MISLKKNQNVGVTMDAVLYKKLLLEQLYQPYIQCTHCPLGFLGRTHVVFGQGNPDASIMFIGEGPGKEEDLQGLPFVGRSGQLLNRVLKGFDLERSDVFITNIVKCRPPHNRQPLPIESNTCKNLLLLKQIKIIQPSIICTLGGPALSCLLEEDVKITKFRGRKLFYDSIPLLPTYHPAYILRNPQEINIFIEDISQVLELSNTLKKKILKS